MSSGGVNAETGAQMLRGLIDIRSIDIKTAFANKLAHMQKHFGPPTYQLVARSDIPFGKSSRSNKDIMTNAVRADRLTISLEIC